MKILVPFKVLPDDQDIVVKADGTLDYSRAPMAVSTFDLNAMEAAAQLASANGAEVVALSVGGPRIDESKLRKNVLARGASSLYLVVDEAFDGADAYVIANAVAAAAEKIGDVDLVVCGNGSADNYAQQVNGQLAELLGASSVCGAESLAVEGDVLVAKRVAEGCRQTLEAAFPAVVSVTPDAAPVRICTMKEILAAGKKPVTVWSAGDLGLEPQPALETVSVLAPKPLPRKGIVLDASDPDAISQFAAALSEASK